VQARIERLPEKRGEAELPGGSTASRLKEREGENPLPRLCKKALWARRSASLGERTPEWSTIERRGGGDGRRLTLSFLRRELLMRRGKGAKAGITSSETNNPTLKRAAKMALDSPRKRKKGVRGYITNGADSLRLRVQRG